MDELNPLQNAVLSLVKQYVARQSIVLDAMRELRPDIIVRLENRIDSMTQAEWIELRLTNQRKSQLGFWGKEQEWQYYFHGGGCRLTHKVTGEKIEWDAGDLNTFNLDWFVHYLQWRLKPSSEDNETRIAYTAFQPGEIIEDDELQHQHFEQFLKMREQILPIVDELCEKGLLSGNAQRLYFIVINNAL